MEAAGSRHAAWCHAILKITQHQHDGRSESQCEGVQAAHWHQWRMRLGRRCPSQCVCVVPTLGVGHVLCPQRAVYAVPALLTHTEAQVAVAPAAALVQAGVQAGDVAVVPVKAVQAAGAPGGEGRRSA